MLLGIWAAAARRMAPLGRSCFSIDAPRFGVD
jgi:hypothetical protein